MGKKKKSKMFHLVVKTWNPITGCYHNCLYCWARKLVDRRLRYMSEKYSDGFKPKLHLKELNKKFPKGALVFCCDMGDAFGVWVDRDWILAVLETIRKNPQTTFLLLTKNPHRYLEFKEYFPSNVILGATIETDIDEVAMEYSQAPLPTIRIASMLAVKKVIPEIPRMISVEPIMLFSDNFAEKIISIEPEFVYVGYDNYDNALLEPPLQKTLELIDKLKEAGIKVYEKTLREANEHSREKTEKLLSSGLLS